MLAFHVFLVALSLRHDVELVQVVLSHLAKCLFALDLSVAEFSAEAEVPILSDFLGPGETVFLCASAAILARKKA